MNKNIFFALLFFSAGLVQAQTEDVIAFRPFSGAEVELTDSWVKDREEANIKVLKALDADRLVHNFRANAGIKSEAQPLDGWEHPGCALRGHYTGHYLSSVAFIVARYDDKELKDRLAYMIDALHECQQKLGGGYLSAFPVHEFEKAETGRRDIWAPYYTYNKIMQGLIDTYVATKNEKALQMASDMADWSLGRMKNMSAEAIENMLFCVDANPTNEPGAMNEVVWKLYRITGKSEHAELARIFDRDWFAVPLAENRNILSGLHSNTHIVLVNGFSQRYAATKETKYRDATMNFWNMLMTQHAYANGSSSGPRPNVVTGTSLTAEHWGTPGVLSNTLTREIAESCVSHNTQKLALELFSWTGDAAYADHYMNTFYNAVLASHNAHTGATTYHLPLGSPRHKHFLRDNDFRCCNGSAIEAFSGLNRSIYFTDGNALWVNLYVPSRLNWKEQNMVVEQTGNFPQDMAVEFKVGTKKSVLTDINFLIPSWARSVKVWVNGQPEVVNAAPCSYMTLARHWTDGDKVRIEFTPDFYLRTMPDDKNMVALFYGPSMLAFETNSELALKGTHADILAGLSSNADGTFMLKNGGKTYILRPLYQIENQSYGVYATIRNYN